MKFITLVHILMSQKWHTYILSLLRSKIQRYIFVIFLLYKLLTYTSYKSINLVYMNFDWTQCILLWCYNFILEILRVINYFHILCIDTRFIILKYCKCNAFFLIFFPAYISFVYFWYYFKLNSFSAYLLHSAFSLITASHSKFILVKGERHHLYSQPTLLPHFEQKLF